MIDDRGQSVVIGTVLVFGMMVVAFSVYHASFVPEQFEETEYEHNQKVQGQFSQASDSIRRSATNGIDSSQTVTFGDSYSVWTAYPAPPMYGQIQTPQDEVTFSGVSIRDNAESNDYWEDGDQTFDTHQIIYQPAYREYQNPPRTILEHGNVFNDYGSESIDMNSQDLVDDDSVNLILIGGDYNETRTGSASLDINSYSPSDSYLQVNGSFTFTIPTERSESWWSEELDEPIVNSYDYRDDEIEVTIDSSNPVSLRITRVSLNSGSNSANYITLSDGAVTVKDQYGNPVSGVEVTVDETSSTYYSTQDGTVDIPDPSQTIHPYIDDNSSDEEFITVESGDLNGGGNDGSGSATTFNSLNSNPASGNKKYKVSYDVEDSDGISEVKFSLRDASNTQLDSATQSESGTTAQGTSGKLNGANGSPDYIRVTVVDSNGNEEYQDVDI